MCRTREGISASSRSTNWVGLLARGHRIFIRQRNSLPSPVMNRVALRELYPHTVAGPRRLRTGFPVMPVGTQTSIWLSERAYAVDRTRRSRAFTVCCAKQLLCSACGVSSVASDNLNVFGCPRGHNREAGVRPARYRHCKCEASPQSHCVSAWRFGKEGRGAAAKLLNARARRPARSQPRERACAPVRGAPVRISPAVPISSKI